jgi:hypothetical protein
MGKGRNFGLSKQKNVYVHKYILKGSDDGV